MILDVFRCSQPFSDVFSWVVTLMDNQTTPCADIFWSSLYVVTNLWQDQDPSIGTKIDHSGSTGSHWETISGSSFPSGSGLEVPSQ